MGLRSRLRRLQKAAEDELDGFELLDGSHFYYDPMEVAKELFLHSYERQLGRPWPEVPDIYLALCARRKTRPPCWSVSCPQTKRRGL